MISFIKSYHILYPISLAVLCFFYYQDTIDLPLDTHDDETLIDNRLIREDPLLFFSSAKKQFTGRPIAEAAKFIVGFPLRDDTRPFHIANIFLHIGNCILLAWLIKRVTQDDYLAILATVLFAVSPIHQQAIHHMSAMDYLLSGGFALGSVQAMLGGRAAWAFILAICSVLSHAASFAPLALLSLFTSHRYRYLAAIALTGLTAIILSLTPAHTSTGTALRGWTDGVQGLWDFIQAYLWLVSRHLTTLLWHFPLTLSFADWEIWVGLGIVMLAVASALPADNRSRKILVVTAVTILPFGLMITDINSGHTGGSARYLYLSAIAFCWFISSGYLWLLRHLPDSKTRLVGIVATISAILVITYGSGSETHISSLYSTSRSRLANNDTAQGANLMLDVLRSPHNRLIDVEDLYMRLGVVAITALEDPKQIIEEGLARYPDNYTLQLFSLSIQTFEGSESAYNRIREIASQLDNIRPVCAYIYNNLGTRYRQLGDREQAIRAYRLAHDIQPQEKYLRYIAELENNE